MYKCGYFFLSFFHICTDIIIVCNTQKYEKQPPPSTQVNKNIKEMTIKLYSYVPGKYPMFQTLLAISSSNRL